MRPRRVDNRGSNTCAPHGFHIRLDICGGDLWAATTRQTPINWLLGRSFHAFVSQIPLVLVSIVASVLLMWRHTISEFHDPPQAVLQTFR